MDFFERQARARRESRRLLWLFVLTVLAVLAVDNLLIGSLVACIRHPALENVSGWHPLNIFISALQLMATAMLSPGRFLSEVFELQPVLCISAAALASIAGGCYFKLRELADGGAVVAEFLGGRPVSAQTADADERRLRNVVEEMAIASGMPVPAIYVLDCERGINSFAAGHTRDDAAIAVTRGCLRLLSRDELQGVIAHEFSHILNGDTRLNMRLIGLAHGLFWPTILGRRLIYVQADSLPTDSSPLTDGNRAKLLPTAPLGFLLVVLGGFSLPFVRLVKSAICRQREWLADAAAVQFTRNPDGLTGALKKIGGLPKQGRLDTPQAELASHLYFVSCHYPAWFAFLATHPSLAKRVTAIDPRFDGNFPAVKMLAPNQAERENAYAQFLCESMAANRILGKLSEPATETITSDHLRQASLIRLGLPEELKRALRTPGGAAAAVYALLLSDEAEARARQMEILQRNLEAGAWSQFTAVSAAVAAIEETHKLPLAEFAVPALRENDEAANQIFNNVVGQMIACDESLGLFEYTLTKMVQRQLRAYFYGPQTAQPRYGRVQLVLPQCAILLSALAHVGNEDEGAARAAFRQGAECLDVPGEKPAFLTRREWDLAGVDAALTEIANYHEPLRRNVLYACGKTVAADGRVTVREAELLRAIADSLNCPLPPFVEAMRSEEFADEKTAA